MSAKACPVALPRRVGERKTFTAHGTSFQIKQVRRGDFFLAKDVSSPPRSRWGNRAQICADIRNVLAVGELPLPKDWL